MWGSLCTLLFHIFYSGIDVIHNNFLKLYVKFWEYYSLNFLFRWFLYNCHESRLFFLKLLRALDKSPSRRIYAGSISLFSLSVRLRRGGGGGRREKERAQTKCKLVIIRLNICVFMFSMLVFPLHLMWYTLASYSIEYNQLSLVCHAI